MLILGLGWTDSLEGAIHTGPITNPANGHVYYLLTNNNWTNSEAEAVALGGHLVTINNAAENTWVTTTFGSSGGALWIGLNDVAAEGTFVWASGESVGYTNWASASGEPNNAGGIEDWAQIFPNSDYRYPYWNDAPDQASTFGFTCYGVVETPGASEAAPEPCAAAIWSLLGAIGIGAGWGRKRKQPGLGLGSSAHLACGESVAGSSCEADLAQHGPHA
jgi:hypothetical protein